VQVPTLFSEDPEAAIEALLADEERAHSDLVKYLRVFMKAEHISLEEAVELTKNPR
jgi:hypothetical protein